MSKASKNELICQSDHFVRFAQVWATVSIAVLAAYLGFDKIPPGEICRIVFVFLAFFLAVSFMCAMLCMLLASRLDQVPGRNVLTKEPHAFCLCLIVGSAALVCATGFMLLLFLCSPHTSLSVPQQVTAQMESVVAYLRLKLVLLGTGFGFVTGFFGIGGGWLIVPCLTNIFGLHAEAAVRTSLAYICVAALTKVIPSRRIVWRRRGMILQMMPFLFLGSWVGAWFYRLIRKLYGTGPIAWMVADTWMLSLLLTLLVLVMLLILLCLLVTSLRGPAPGTGGRLQEGDATERGERRIHVQYVASDAYRLFFEWCGFTHVDRGTPEEESHSPGLWFFALLIGVLAGFCGIGGGLFLYPLLLLFLALEGKEAAGCICFLVFVNALLASIGHRAFGEADYSMVLPLVIGGMLGVGISHVLRKSRGEVCERFELPVYAGLLVLAVALTLWKIVAIAEELAKYAN